MKRKMVTNIFFLIAFSFAYGDDFMHGRVSLTFDDGYQSAHAYVLPILQKYQIPATFYVTTSLIGEIGYLTAKEIVEMSELGHEIGSHAVHHQRLTQLSNYQVEDELRESKVFLEGLLQKPVLAFAPPYGAFDRYRISLIKKYYSSNRTTKGGVNHFERLNPYDLKVKIVQSTTSQEKIETWLDWTKKNSRWLILVYHHIEDPVSFLTTSCIGLEKHIQAIQDRDLDVVPVSFGYIKD